MTGQCTRTFPVVQNIFCLAVYTVFDGVTVASHLTGGLHGKWASRAGPPVFGTFFPARGCAIGSGRSWSSEGAQPSPAQQSSQIVALAESSHGRLGKYFFK